MSALNTFDANEYDLVLRDYLSELLAEFLSVPECEVRSRVDMELLAPGSLIAKAWQRADPRTPNEIIKFYQETDSYLYGLASDHCHSGRASVWGAVVRRIERRGLGQHILVYGDGIGTDSIALARRNHRVTYFDLPGKTSDFARFRFAKEGLGSRIAIAVNPTEIPAERFESVLSIEVLEHLADPPAAMQTFHGFLKSGGIALITESFESVGPDFPSHLPENFQYAGKTHLLMERIGFANTYSNLDPVNRPIEFTKIESNLSGHIRRLECRARRAIHTRWHRYISHR